MLTDGYEAVRPQGHDEYWTKEMLDVENRIFRQGKNAGVPGRPTPPTGRCATPISTRRSAAVKPRPPDDLLQREKYDPDHRPLPDEQKAMPYVTNMFRWNSRLV